MAGHIDDVIDPSHHEQIAVLVEVSSISGQVKAGMFAEVRRLEPRIVIP